MDVGAGDDGGGLVARYGLSHIYNLVGGMLVIDGQAHPLVHRHQTHLVAYGGLQHWVATFPSKTVGVGHVAAQHPIVGSLNLHGIVGHQLHFARLGHQCGGREEMVIRAALLGLMNATEIVVCADVLVAKSQAHLTEGQRATVLGEEDVVPLALFRL